MSPIKRWSFLAVVSGVAVALDQASKQWATDALQTGPKVVFPSWFRFEYAENPGAAWNFLSGASASFRYPFFLFLGIAMIVFIGVYYSRTRPDDRWNQWGLALVLGGGLGNFIDRVRIRHVVDFIVWHVGDKYQWPTFNVADAAIFVGVVVLFLASFQKQRAAAT